MDRIYLMHRTKGTDTAMMFLHFTAGSYILLLHVLPASRGIEDFFLLALWFIVMFFWRMDMKIGISNKVDRRRKNIDRDMPGDVSVWFSIPIVSGARRTENWLKKVFKHRSFIPKRAGKRAGKGEWYKFNIYEAVYAIFLMLYAAVRLPILVIISVGFLYLILVFIRQDHIEMFNF